MNNLLLLVRGGGHCIDILRFQALGVVEQTLRHSFDEVDSFFGKTS